MTYIKFIKVDNQYIVEISGTETKGTKKVLSNYINRTKQDIVKPLLLAQ